MKKSLIMLFIVVVLVVSGCVQDTINIPSNNYITPHKEYGKDPSSESKSETLKNNKVDPVIERVEPYISKITSDDVNLRIVASSIVSDCDSNNKECHVSKIYRYIVDEFKYYSDPRDSELIQSPIQTKNMGGGDCEDLSILLNSLLESIGIKSYLVFTDNHTYSMACGINTTLTMQYSLLHLSEKMEDNYDLGKTEKTAFVLKPFNSYYYGGDGYYFDKDSIVTLLIAYKVHSDRPVNIQIIPSNEDFNKASNGESYTHYPDCERENVLKATSECTIERNGGILLTNPSYYSVNVDLEISFEMKSLPLVYIFERYKDRQYLYYNLNGEECLVLDATSGKYSIPGFTETWTSTKYAVDPKTKEYYYLT